MYHKSLVRRISQGCNMRGGVPSLTIGGVLVVGYAITAILQLRIIPPIIISPVSALAGTLFERRPTNRISSLVVDDVLVSRSTRKRNTAAEEVVEVVPSAGRQDRRKFFRVALMLGVVITPFDGIVNLVDPHQQRNSAAYAVQPRNEALCKTGLFENFQEYRCTPIGNILDEGGRGSGKSLDEQEQSAVDGLMSKMMMGGGGNEPQQQTAAAVENNRVGAESTSRSSSIANNYPNQLK